METAPPNQTPGNQRSSKVGSGQHSQEDLWLQTVKAPTYAVKILGFVHLQNRSLVIRCTTSHIFSGIIFEYYSRFSYFKDQWRPITPFGSQAGDEPGPPVAAAQLRGLRAGDQRRPLRGDHSRGPGKGGAGGLGGAAGGALGWLGQRQWGLVGKMILMVNDDGFFLLISWDESI